MGDLNASIGKKGQPKEYFQIMRRFRPEQITNRNREKLINFCMENNLCIPQSFYPQKREEKITFLNAKYMEDESINHLEKAKQIDHCLVPSSQCKLLKIIKSTG